MAIPNGEIYLLKDVPLSSTYEHTIDFKDKNEQYNYFRKFIKYPLMNYSYIRKEREYISVGMSFSELDDVNYLMFRSSENDRLFYAFVTDKKYIANGTTQLFFTVDVLQTYAFEYEWRASYIVQGHVNRWTADNKPIYSKTDEGLAYGTEYAVESAYALRQSDKTRWVLVCLKDYSELLSEGFNTSATHINPVNSSFALLLIPIALDLRNHGRHKVYDEEIGIIGDYSHFTRFMHASALGNYVQSITLLPYNPLILSETVEGDYVYHQFKSGVEYNKVAFKNDNVNYIVLTDITNSNEFFKKVLAITDWDTGLKSSLPTPEEWEEIKRNPYTTKRDKRFESKLLCAPYRYNLLTDWRGDPVILKNEYMTTDKLEIYLSYALTPQTPFRYWVKDYKKDPEGRYTSLTQPLALDFPIISDAYYTYMLENKNTIQANLTNAVINAGAGVISGAISGAGVGGIGGAAFGAFSGAVSGALNVSAQLRSENAKQADLKAKPDTVINSSDGSFNVHDKNTDITFYRMRICCENEEILSEIFNISGYKVNRVEVPDTRSRVRFNYIQTAGANIVGSFSQNDLTKIKEIYNTGITIWHYSEKDFNMLDYSYENIERSLL